MNAKLPTHVYKVTLTEEQKKQALFALQNRQDFLKRAAAQRLDDSLRRIIEDSRQSNAEALRIIGEAEPLELDAEGNIL